MELVNIGWMQQATAPSGSGTLTEARQAILVNWYCFDDSFDVLASDLPCLGTPAAVIYSEPLVDLGANAEGFVAQDDWIIDEEIDHEIILGSPLALLTFSDTSAFFLGKEIDDQVYVHLWENELEAFNYEALVF